MCFFLLFCKKWADAELGVPPEGMGSLGNPTGLLLERLAYFGWEEMAKSVWQSLGTRPLHLLRRATLGGSCHFL